MKNTIQILGARENNLKNIDLSFEKNKLIVITGVSGSGKSSLAFNTIYAEGQRRYMESFSAYARSFIGTLERPDVDKINGLSPVISIEQKTTSKNPRSTVGTLTEIYDFLRLLYARASVAYSYLTGAKMVIQTMDQIVENVIKKFNKVKKEIMVSADREASSGVRYKYGRNLNSRNKNVMKIDNPKSFRLPVFGPQFNYLIAKNDSYFLYPNEANKYKQKLQNSFQHGGISLEEMLIPVVRLKGIS